VVRGRLDRSGSVSPILTTFLSKRWRVLQQSHLHPPCKWLCVSERCRPFRISQCRHLSKSLGANSHGNFFVVSVDPSGRTCCPKRATRDSASVLPNIREWLSLLAPWENCGSRTAFKMPPAEPFAGHVCTNGSAWLKDHIPPRMDLSVREFKLFSVASPRKFSGRYPSADSVWPPHQGHSEVQNSDPNLSLDKLPGRATRDPPARVALLGRCRRLHPPSLDLSIRQTASALMS
jgi:hypothetical protein